MKNKTLILTKETGWYGGHSGFYEQLGKILQQAPFESQIIKPKKTLSQKIIGRMMSLRFGIEPSSRSDYSSSVELEYFLRMTFPKTKSCVYT